MDANKPADDVTVRVLEHALFPEAPSAKIGRFVIERRLGRGGMGVVYLARDPQLKRNVALKIHPRDADADLRRRIRKEAESLARLRHRNVVTVHEVGEDNGQVFVVMEYLQGRTLDVWVREDQPSAQTIVGVLLQCAHGLAAAHAAGLVHRDFKPTNVLLDHDGTPKIIDFGIATERGDSTPIERLESKDTESVDRTQTALAGTPRYMAPELWRGAPPSANTDQFSWCATAFELLVGERPYVDTQEAERLPPRPRTLQRRLWRVLRRGLDPQANRRYSSIDDLVSHLEPMVRTRGRWWLVAAAITLAVVGVVATVALTNRTQPPQQVSTPATTSAPPLSPCTIGHDYLAEKSEWSANTSNRVSFPKDELRISPGEIGATEYVYARMTRPTNLEGRALEFEIAHAPAGGEDRELMIGIEDEQERIIAAVLLIEGRWVFPIAPGLRDLEFEAGPDDRHFRIQFDGVETITYEIGVDGKTWRSFARTRGRLQNAFAFVAAGTHKQSDPPDESRVASLRCVAPHQVAPLPYDRDLTRPRGQ